jgi:hypothetical protein
MAAKVFTTFAEVQQALQNFVGPPNNIPVAGAPHQNMWERGSTAGDQYNAFVTGQVFLPGSGYPTTGYPILVKGNGQGSNIIMALSGSPAFPFGQMPPSPYPSLDQETIDAISAWIDAGANQ